MASIQFPCLPWPSDLLLFLPLFTKHLFAVSTSFPHPLSSRFLVLGVAFCLPPDKMTCLLLRSNVSEGKVFIFSPSTDGEPGLDNDRVNGWICMNMYVWNLTLTLQKASAKVSSERPLHHSCQGNGSAVAPGFTWRWTDRKGKGNGN